MSNGSYDRRAPSAASQIITLERLLEESEERNAELEATIAKLEEVLREGAEYAQNVLDSSRSYIEALEAENKALIDANVEVANINAGLLVEVEALEAAIKGHDIALAESYRCGYEAALQEKPDGKS